MSITSRMEFDGSGFEVSRSTKSLSFSLASFGVSRPFCLFVQKLENRPEGVSMLLSEKLVLAPAGVASESLFGVCADWLPVHQKRVPAEAGEIAHAVMPIIVGLGITVGFDIVGCRAH